jgi:hypothetical protein
MNKLFKRCICGLSSAFPICDGAHGSKDWSCKFQPPTQVERCFLAGPHYVNLAEKLSFRFSGLAANKCEGRIKCSEVIIITDGGDIEYVTTELKRIKASELLVLAVGIPPEALGHRFPKSRIVPIQEFPLPALWHQAEKACMGDSIQASPNKPLDIFLSHSSQDENLLLPAINFLRKNLGFRFFVCADSIEPGSKWLPKIKAELQNSDVFIYVSSTSSNHSTFCAFECGCAMALGKNIRIISIDEVPPPAHIQDIQALELPRFMKRKPWLDFTQALIEAFMVSSENQPSKEGPD